MGGTYTDHPDPRLRARTEMPSAPDNAGINVERPLLSVETNPTLPNDINKVEPVETVTPAAIPALDDDKKISSATDGERTSTCNNGSDLHVYIADLLAQITKETKKNAVAIQQCADIQKEHAVTTAKYRDAHGRWTHSNKIRLSLEESYQRCVKKKDEAIGMIETLRKENADLLQIHADLSQESAELKSDNASLVTAIQPRDAMILQLQAEVASLKASWKPKVAEQMQHETVKTERISLQKNNDSIQWTPARDNDRERGRSGFRSRSPQRSSDRKSGQSTRHDGIRDSRYRECSRGRSSYRGRECQVDDRYQQYIPCYDGPPAGLHKREPSRPAHRGRSRPASRESIRIPESRATHEMHYAPSSHSPYDLPNIGNTKDGSHQYSPDGVPTAPRNHVLFSMGQAKKKLSRNSLKHKNEIDRYRPDKK